LSAEDLSAEDLNTESLYCQEDSADPISAVWRMVAIAADLRRHQSVLYFAVAEKVAPKIGDGLHGDAATLLDDSIPAQMIPLTQLTLQKFLDRTSTGCRQPTYRLETLPGIVLDLLFIG